MAGQSESTDASGTHKKKSARRRIFNLILLVSAKEFIVGVEWSRDDYLSLHGVGASSILIQIRAIRRTDKMLCSTLTLPEKRLKKLRRATGILEHGKHFGRESHAYEQGDISSFSFRRTKSHIFGIECDHDF